MAEKKHPDPTHCSHCGKKLTYQRLTLPRARTGDLGFCNYACGEAWRADKAQAAHATA